MKFELINWLELKFKLIIIDLTFFVNRGEDIFGKDNQAR